MLKGRVIKIVLLLVISLLTTTSGISQDISTCIVNKDTMILISPTQLKTANLIFNEHFELKHLNGLLNRKISQYEELIDEELRIDSIYEAEVTNLHLEISDCSETIQNQSNTINKLNKHKNCWRNISIITVILLICML